VLRACNAGAARIVIIDGYFDQVPSVMHKEILYALERGIVVLGSSSMGALRAAELHAFGMVGVGRVFELYRDGMLEDDDEVAVAHGPADTGYRCLSDALVDIRDRLDAAVAAGMLEPERGARWIAAVKSLPYPARSFRALATSVRQEGDGQAGTERLAEFLTRPHATLKQRDAVALLDHLALGGDRPIETPARVERTVFFERLRLTVEQEDAASVRPAPPVSGELDDVLLGLLAEEHADLLLAPPPEDEIARVTEEILAACGLTSREDFERWLQERGVSAEDLAVRVRERAAIERLSQLYAPEIERRRLARMRLPPI
jgi:hypothetical protein